MNATIQEIEGIDDYWGPAFRSVYEGEGHEAFVQQLDERIVQHDKEIEKLCNFHYQPKKRKRRQPCKPIKSAGVSTGYHSSTSEVQYSNSEASPRNYHSHRHNATSQPHYNLSDAVALSYDDKDKPKRRRLDRKRLGGYSNAFPEADITHRNNTNRNSNRHGLDSSLSVNGDSNNEICNFDRFTDGTTGHDEEKKGTGNWEVDSAGLSREEYDEITEYHTLANQQNDQGPGLENQPDANSSDLRLLLSNRKQGRDASIERQQTLLSKQHLDRGKESFERQNGRCRGTPDETPRIYRLETSNRGTFKRHDDSYNVSDGHKRRSTHDEFEERGENRSSSAGHHHEQRSHCSDNRHISNFQVEQSASNERHYDESRTESPGKRIVLIQGQPIYDTPNECHYPPAVVGNKSDLNTSSDLRFYLKSKSKVDVSVNGTFPGSHRSRSNSSIEPNGVNVTREANVYDSSSFDRHNNETRYAITKRHGQRQPLPSEGHCGESRGKLTELHHDRALSTQYHQSHALSAELHHGQCRSISDERHDDHNRDFSPYDQKHSISDNPRYYHSDALSAEQYRPSPHMSTVLDHSQYRSLSTELCLSQRSLSTELHRSQSNVLTAEPHYGHLAQSRPTSAEIHRGQRRPISAELHRGKSRTTSAELHYSQRRFTSAEVQYGQSRPTPAEPYRGQSRTTSAEHHHSRRPSTSSELHHDQIRPTSTEHYRVQSRPTSVELHHGQSRPTSAELYRSQSHLTSMEHHRSQSRSTLAELRHGQICSTSREHYRAQSRPRSVELHRGQNRHTTVELHRGQSRPTSAELHHGQSRPASSELHRGQSRPTSVYLHHSQSRSTSAEFHRGQIRPTSTEYHRGQSRLSSAEFHRGQSRLTFAELHHDQSRPTSAEIHRGRSYSTSAVLHRGKSRPTSGELHRSQSNPTSVDPASAKLHRGQSYTSVDLHRSQSRPTSAELHHSQMRPTSAELHHSQGRSTSAELDRGPSHPTSSELRRDHNSPWSAEIHHNRELPAEHYYDESRISFAELQQNSRSNMSDGHHHEKLHHMSPERHHSTMLIEKTEPISISSSSKESSREATACVTTNDVKNDVKIEPNSSHASVERQCSPAPVIENGSNDDPRSCLSSYLKSKFICRREVCAALSRSRSTSSESRRGSFERYDTMRQCSTPDPNVKIEPNDNTSNNVVDGKVFDVPTESQITSTSTEIIVKSEQNDVVAPVPDNVHLVSNILAGHSTEHIEVLPKKIPLTVYSKRHQSQSRDVSLKNSLEHDTRDESAHDLLNTGASVKDEHSAGSNDVVRSKSLSFDVPQSSTGERQSNSKEIQSSQKLCQPNSSNLQPSSNELRSSQKQSQSSPEVCQINPTDCQPSPNDRQHITVRNVEAINRSSIQSSLSSSNLLNATTSTTTSSDSRLQSSNDTSEQIILLKPVQSTPDSHSRSEPNCCSYNAVVVDRDPRLRPRHDCDNHLNVQNEPNTITSQKSIQSTDTLPTVANSLPDFNPSNKNRCIDTWISNVNEVSLKCNWTEQQVIEFAMSKLAGNAKRWYDGFTSNFSWDEWQNKLRTAFPADENYGKILSDMLNKTAKAGDSLQDYYLEKITLLNRCSIKGKKAVDCIVFGIEDDKVRANAEVKNFAEPDKLLEYFDNVKENNCVVDMERINNDLIDNP